MKILVGTLGSLLLAIFGCGGSGGNTFACVMGSGTGQLCIETTTNVPGNPNCGAGMRVDACPRAGADGACRHSFSSGGASISQTIWYYSGTAGETSQEMSDCTNNGGSWMQP